jgi:hypothetical protein
MEWISVNDRLPEDKPNDPNVFITCDKDGFVFGCHHYFGGGSMDVDGFYSLVDMEWEYDDEVTHWMPLPEPPLNELSCDLISHNADIITSGYCSTCGSDKTNYPYA